MSKNEPIFDIDHLMDRVSREALRIPGVDEVSQIVNDLHTQRWLTFQRLIDGAIQAKLNMLSIEDLTKDGALQRIARLQGEVIGLRGFWDTLHEVAEKAQEKIEQ